MVEPVSIVSGGISIAQGLSQFVQYLKGIVGSDVIAAYFTAAGTRIYGSDIIEIDRHSDQQDPKAWYYSVKEVPEYAFVRMPVIESCVHELTGMVVGTENPDARYWRWVAQRPQGVMYGSGPQPNVLVDFIVVGYRPKALVQQFSTRPSRP